MLVHGAFLRDDGRLDPWGEIPSELSKNGAVIYRGNQNAVCGVEENGIFLARRIEEIIEKSGAEKLNIIAHSKGGLDSRYAISVLEKGRYVASLTTINTPHGGCRYIDFLLKVLPGPIKSRIVDYENKKFLRLGDTRPDFLKTITDLSAKGCLRLNSIMPDDESVYYQSFGTKLLRASDAQPPLNRCYRFIKLFDGENDGLCGEYSQRRWENYRLLRPDAKAKNRYFGYSHWDIADWRGREYIRPDILKLYVDIADELRKRGF